MAYYGTLSEAVAYFASRLHSQAWDNAAATDKPKALTQAARIIDSLNYKGVKAAVYPVVYDDDGLPLSPAPTEDAVLAADATQELEFPRGRDTAVPNQIKWAQWEIAFALLDGFDPDEAMDAMRVKSQTYSAVKTTYADGDQSTEYLLYGIPSGTVWRWLLPYLSDIRIIRLSRAD
jgi:hypothetical protein